MARDPGSLWSPLLENGQQGSYTKSQFIVHSTGDRGTAAAIFNYFNRAEVVVESTFVVGRGPEDPTRQLLDSASGADANLGANQRAICVEVVGAAGDDYTDWQVSEIVRLGRWARATHPIEPRICPTHNQSGFGWHVMFGSPGPWTPAAKSCPGPVRIQRLKTIVFPAIIAADPHPAAVPESTPRRREMFLTRDDSNGAIYLWTSRGATHLETPEEVECIKVLLDAPLDGILQHNARFHDVVNAVFTRAALSANAV